MTSPKFDGAVIAGGRSSRMGRDKAALTVCGELLIIRQLRIIRAADANPVWLSVGPNTSMPKELDADVAVLRDDVLAAGPMAGLERILGSMRNEWCLVI